ncbi:glycerophosphodiester phosphodiesterase [bacterium]|nr:glycerophosphodiester phosphodiesterase [bacterium]
MHFDNKFLIIAHHGGPRYPRETLIPQFNEAIRQGAGMLEFDLRETREGISVVNHDPKWRTHGNDDGLVIAEAPLYKLRTTDSDDSDRIVTGKEVFLQFGRTIPLNAEGKTAGVLLKSLPLLRDFKILDNVLLSAFDGEEHMKGDSPSWGELLYAKHLEPRIAIALLAGSYESFERAVHLSKAYRGKVFAIHPSIEILELGDNMLSMCNRAHSVGVKIMPYVVNDPEMLRDLEEFGYDGAFCDFPNSA